MCNLTNKFMKERINEPAEKVDAWMVGVAQPNEWDSSVTAPHK